MAHWIPWTDPWTGKAIMYMNHQIYCCSDCNTYGMSDKSKKVGVVVLSNEFKRCPFCGARMLQQQEKKTVL